VDSVVITCMSGQDGIQHRRANCLSLKTSLLVFNKACLLTTKPGVEKKDLMFNIFLLYEMGISVID